MPSSVAHVCAGNSITDQVATRYQGPMGLKKWKIAVIAVAAISGTALVTAAAVFLWARRQALMPAQIVRYKVYIKLAKCVAAVKASLPSAHASAVQSVMSLCSCLL